MVKIDLILFQESEWLNDSIFLGLIEAVKKNMEAGAAMGVIISFP